MPLLVKHTPMARPHITQGIEQYSNQVILKLLVLGAVKTIINDQEFQHVTGRSESIRMLLNKLARWPIFVQSHPSVKTVD